MKRKNRALSLIEVILAMWILFIAICFIFEVLRTSYTYVTKLKIIAQLESMTTSRMETILYNNTYNPDPINTWITFPQDTQFLYKISATTLSSPSCFPNYTLTQVDLESKGPVGRPNIPEFTLSLTTIVIDTSQAVSSTEDRTWGEGLSPEAATQ